MVLSLSSSSTFVWKLRITLTLFRQLSAKVTFSLKIVGLIWTLAQFVVIFCMDFRLLFFNCIYYLFVCLLAEFFVVVCLYLFCFCFVSLRNNTGSGWERFVPFYVKLFDQLIVNSCGKILLSLTTAQFFCFFPGDVFVWFVFCIRFVCF